MCFGFSVMIAWAATRSKGHLRSVWGHVCCLYGVTDSLFGVLHDCVPPSFVSMAKYPYMDCIPLSSISMDVWWISQSHEWVNKLIFKNKNNWRKQNGIPQTNNQVLDWTYNDFKVLGICKLLGIFKNELLWISIDNMVAIKQLLHEHDTDVIPKWFLQ